MPRIKFKNGVEALLLQSPHDDLKILVSASYNEQPMKTLNSLVDGEQLVKLLRVLELYDPLEANLDLSIN